MDVSLASAENTTTKQSNSGFGGDQVMNENFDQFLMMLTTQLQNQDPTDPLDTEQFTQQLVSFAGVEQQIKTNSQLEALTGLQAYNQLAAGVGLIGRWVEADGDGLTLENGQGFGAYTIEGEAESAELTVYDENGRRIHSMSVPASPGHHEFTWDGTDSQGRTVPDGAYTFNVRGRDADGEPVSSFTSTIGRVSGVETDEEGRMLLVMGENKVPLSLIMQVHDIET